MGKTTKSDLVDALSKECSIPPRETWKVVDTVLKSMSDALSRGESIQLRGFGTFKIKQYGTYQGTNPRTGERVKVKPKKLPVFRVGKHLQQAVNKNRNN